jgi:hypothetical protein
VVGPESGIDVPYAVERLDEKRTADQEHRRQRKLSGDEEPQCAPTPRRAGAATGGGVNGGANITAHRVQGRSPSKE